MNDFASHRGVKRRVRNTSAECLRATQFEKYYTTVPVARQCLELMEPFIGPGTLLIEPSAGGGSFLEATDRDIIGFDVEPDHDLVIKRDFLSLPIRHRRNVAIIGNTPFGPHGEIATIFINRGLAMAGTVGFILPVTFQKWRMQTKVNPTARLVLDHELPSQSFTFCGRAFDARCTFQIWTMDDRMPDLRLTKKPPNSHPDFEIMRIDQANPHRAEGRDWDFAVRRFGCVDYSKKLWSEAELLKGRDYLLFNAASATVLRRLMQIDFHAVALRNSFRPCLSFTDIVEAYSKIAEDAS